MNNRRSILGGLGTVIALLALALALSQDVRFCRYFNSCAVLGLQTPTPPLNFNISPIRNYSQLVEFDLFDGAGASRSLDRSRWYFEDSPYFNAYIDRDRLVLESTVPVGTESTSGCWYAPNIGQSNSAIEARQVNALQADFSWDSIDQGTSYAGISMYIWPRDGLLSYTCDIIFETGNATFACRNWAEGGGEYESESVQISTNDAAQVLIAVDRENNIFQGMVNGSIVNTYNSPSAKDITASEITVDVHLCSLPNSSQQVFIDNVYLGRQR